MTYEDLEKRDVFLPEEAWGDLELRSSASPVGMAGAALLGLGGCFAIAWGGGSWITWAGALVFLASLAVFGVLSSLGIERQNRRVDELIRGRPPAGSRG